LLKEHFIVLAVSNEYINGRTGQERDFVRSIGGPFSGAGTRTYFTASGKKLGHNIPAALAAWKALPKSDRKPKETSPGARGKKKGDQPKPPAGTLILKLYYRTLTRTADGFRAAAARDFEHRRRGAYMFEAQPGFLWLTRSEWQSLIPNDPKKGDRHAVAAPLAQRIFCRYLHPVWAYGDGGAQPWRKEDIRDSRLALLVEDVSAASVRLRLTGFAQLGKAFDPKLKVQLTEGESVGVGYEPRLLGYLTYDRKAKRITRFDAVAVGDFYGKMHGSFWDVYRPGRQPLGVAFELIAADSPANRVGP
jgi:hypothetical protein